MEDNTRKYILRIGLVTIILCAIVATAYFIVKDIRFGSYESYEVVSEQKVTNDKIAFYNTNNLLSMSTINGARALDGDGNLQWDVAFGLENPTVVSCKKVSAVADIDGTSVIVVSDDGISHRVEVNYPIVKIDVAQQGVTAILMNDGDSDYIQVYDIDGKCRIDIGTKTKNEGFPVDIALSDDGKKLVTVYVSFKGDEILSKVTFYNAGDVGKNFIENIVGQKTFEGRLVCDVDFLGNDNVGIMLDDGFVLYNMKEIPEFVIEKTFDEEILDFCMYDTGICTVTKTADERKLYFYDLNGKEVGTVKNVPAYDKLRADNDEAILYSSQRVSIYRKNGTLKFNCYLDEMVDDVFFGGDNRYFFVDSGSIKAIKLVKKVKEEN